jgi:hypothetical protein
MSFSLPINLGSRSQNGVARYSLLAKSSYLLLLLSFLFFPLSLLAQNSTLDSLQLENSSGRLWHLSVADNGIGCCSQLAWLLAQESNGLVPEKSTTMERLFSIVST